MSSRSQDKLSTPIIKWEQEVKEAEEMVNDARAWLADAEATLAVCKENRDKASEQRA
jgi:hypothetical protein